MIYKGAKFDRPYSGNGNSGASSIAVKFISKLCFNISIAIVCRLLTVLRASRRVWTA